MAAPADHLTRAHRLLDVLAKEKLRGVFAD
jgi:hypothetical protein